MADRLYLDETGLRLYDAKLKTYITDQMDKALEDVMHNFSQGMKIMGTIEPKSDEIEMALTISDPQVGHTYIFKIDMNQYKDGVTIRYYDGEGYLVSETARNNDTITCIKEAVYNTDATSPDEYQPARWALLAGNWDFDAPDSTPKLDLSEPSPGETKHVSLGVLNGTDLGFDVPSATEVTQQIGTALTEGGFVKVDKIGDLHSNATDVISATEPDGKNVATDKAVYKFVHTSAETLNPTNNTVTVANGANLNNGNYNNPTNYYVKAATAKTLTNTPWGSAKSDKATAFVMRVVKLSNSVTERTVIAEDGMRYVQKTTTSGSTTEFGDWKAVTLDGMTGLGIHPYEDTVGLEFHYADGEKNEFEIAPATQDTAGVMSADDKKKMIFRDNSIKVLAGKTVSEIRTALDEWLSETKCLHGASFRTTLKMETLYNAWNSGESGNNVVIDEGSYHTFEISHGNTEKFTQIRITAQQSSIVWYVGKSTSWGNIRKVAFKEDTLSATGQNNGVNVQLGGTLGSPTVTVKNTLGTVDMSNSAYAVAGNTIAKSVPLLVGASGTEIKANSDLNTILQCWHLLLQ